jgi:hypothetical protein
MSSDFVDHFEDIAGLLKGEGMKPRAEPVLGVHGTGAFAYTGLFFFRLLQTFLKNSSMS